MDYQTISDKINRATNQADLFDVRADISKYRAEADDINGHKKLLQRYMNRSIKLAEGNTHA